MKRDTYTKRRAIGFPENPRDWGDLPARFRRDRLEIAGHSIIEEWERGYMKRLAEVAASRQGKVLKVGFGLGISASFIQGHDIEEHLIIEANRQVYMRLKRFAARAPQRVTPIEGFWQDVTKDMPDESVSSILFDTYPLSASEMHRNHFSFFAEAYRLLKKGGVLTYYSDEASDFSRDHRTALVRAGFRDIQKDICRVDPPKDCLYWRDETLMVPIVFK